MKRLIPSESLIKIVRSAMTDGCLLRSSGSSAVSYTFAVIDAEVIHSLPMSSAVSSSAGSSIVALAEVLKYVSCFYLSAFTLLCPCNWICRWCGVPNKESVNWYFLEPSSFKGVACETKSYQLKNPVKCAREIFVNGYCLHVCVRIPLLIIRKPWNGMHKK